MCTGTIPVKRTRKYYDNFVITLIYLSVSLLLPYRQGQDKPTQQYFYSYPFSNIHRKSEMTQEGQS